MAGSQSRKANGDGNSGVPWKYKLLAAALGAGVVVTAVELSSTSAVCVEKCSATTQQQGGEQGTGKSVATTRPSAGRSLSIPIAPSSPLVVTSSLEATTASPTASGSASSSTLTSPSPSASASSAPVTPTTSASSRLLVMSSADNAQQVDSFLVQGASFPPNQTLQVRAASSSWTIQTDAAGGFSLTIQIAGLSCGWPAEPVQFAVLDANLDVLKRQSVDLVDLVSGLLKCLGL